jgi:surface antigen
MVACLPTPPRSRLLWLLCLLAVLWTLWRVAPAHAAGQTSAAPNPFPWGQCTWWAAQERPDLIGAVWGDAEAWAWEAGAAGRRVDTSPAPGAILVLPAWSFGAWGAGHVAYVVAVGRLGWVLVSEMDWQPWGPGVNDYRWVWTGWGVSYIH